MAHSHPRIGQDTFLLVLLTYATCGNHAPYQDILVYRTVVGFPYTFVVPIALQSTSQIRLDRRLLAGARGYRLMHSKE